MSGRTQFLVVAVLFLLPMSVLTFSDGVRQEVPEPLRSLWTMKLEPMPASSVWPSYHVVGQTNRQGSEPVVLKWSDFGAANVVGHRSRIEAAIAATDGQSTGEATRRAAANYIAQRLTAIEPEVPPLQMVQFTAVDRTVGNAALASPWGSWQELPQALIMQSRAKLRLIGSYPVGQAEARMSPLVFKASVEFDDNALRDLVGKSRATDVDLSASKVTGDGLAILAKHATLRVLRLKDLPVSEKDLTWLPRMPKLAGLDVSGTQVTDGWLPDLKKMSKLEELHLARTKLSSAAVQALAPMINLTVLDVSETALERSTLLQLGAWPRLKTLTIQKLNLGEVGAMGVMPHSGLLKMDLSGAVIGKGGLGILRHFSALNTLNLAEAKIVDGDLGQLAPMTSLQSLDVSNTTVTEAGLRTLMKVMPSLKTIRWGKDGERTMNPIRTKPLAAGNAAVGPPTPSIKRAPTDTPNFPGAAPRGVTGNGKMQPKAEPVSPFRSGMPNAGPRPSPLPRNLPGLRRPEMVGPPAPGTANKAPLPSSPAVPSPTANPSPTPIAPPVQAAPKPTVPQQNP